MESTQAILIVAGESPCVLELADGKLEGTVKQRCVAGSSPNGEPLEENVIIVEIPTGLDDDDSPLDAVENWLNRHRDTLMTCDADKTLEFYTYMEHDIGSRTLTIPHSMIRVAADLNLNVANQAIRIFTEEEYAKLRG